LGNKAVSIEVRLANFDGPLDLLLHLIKTNAMDIYDIPMVEITDQYLAAMEKMEQLNLDIAGEFLLMAASLMHIKSKMLLPVAAEDDPEDETLDPRAELVRRLLEYQRYKQAAQDLEQLPWLERDIFPARIQASEFAAEPGVEVAGADVGIYQLAAAFHRLMQEAKVETIHEVMREQLSVRDYIEKIFTRLVACKRLALGDFLHSGASRQELVVTFLAMLELVKMRLLEVSQSAEFQPLWLKLTPHAPGVDPQQWREEGFGYG
jgi:segregation and condensation protein A